MLQYDFTIIDDPLTPYFFNIQKSFPAKVEDFLKWESEELREVINVKIPILNPNLMFAPDESAYNFFVDDNLDFVFDWQLWYTGFTRNYRHLKFGIPPWAEQKDNGFWEVVIDYAEFKEKDYGYVKYSILEWASVYYMDTIRFVNQILEEAVING